MIMMINILMCNTFSHRICMRESERNNGPLIQLRYIVSKNKYVQSYHYIVAQISVQILWLWLCVCIGFVFVPLECQEEEEEEVKTIQTFWTHWTHRNKHFGNAIWQVNKGWEVEVWVHSLVKSPSLPRSRSLSLPLLVYVRVHIFYIYVYKISAQRRKKQKL